MTLGVPMFKVFRFTLALAEVVSLRTPIFFKILALESPCLVDSRRRSAVLILFALLLVLPGGASADDVYIRICNRGDVGVWMAAGTDRGLWGGLHVNGWWEYKPGNKNIVGGCTAVLVDEGNGVFLAFMVLDTDGELVPILLPPSGDGDLEPTGMSACLDLDKTRQVIEWDETNSSECPKSETLIPFSAYLNAFDYASNKQYDVTYTVRPSAPMSERDREAKKQQQREDRDWSRAKSANNARAYRRFMDSWPESARAKDAQGRAWRATRSSGSLDSFRDFAESWPNSEYVQEAEEAGWRAAKSLDSIDAYENYLDTWPDSAHSTAAKSRISELTPEKSLAQRMWNLVWIWLVEVLL